ncbi:MAG: cardiolipin synthase [Silvanigrellales bacterium]|nr:cardiolipin synthase [Silvanigrellales bacterium]
MFSEMAELFAALWSPRESFRTLTFWGALSTCVYIMGLLNAAHAIMNVRLSQSAIAWSVFLVTTPWVGIPAYWVFGRRKFNGYTNSLRRARAACEADINLMRKSLAPHVSNLPQPLTPLQAYASKFTPIPFVDGNTVRLLVDGEATYGAMFEAIENAREYVFLQTYILDGDATGRKFLSALSNARERGVHICLLYDDVGSFALTQKFLRDARSAGLLCAAFRTTKGRGNRFQLNFRNHRKILVADGSVGFTGGLNIGDDQLGRNPSLGPWRDTHLRMEGPAVKGLESSFLSDWFWATDTLPYPSSPAPQGLAAEVHQGQMASLEKQVDSPLDRVSPPVGNVPVLTLSTGPADGIDICSLFIGALIDVARTRIWIATPYLVPDEPTLAALKSAALRGVDVRILVPAHSDHFILHFCSISFYEEFERVGVKIFAYRKGFMHQKAFVFDDLVAAVGTANFDNRSFHLNFEVMAYVANAPFVSEVADMLARDFEASDAVDLGQYERLSLPKQVMVKCARLFSAIL